MLLPLGLLCFVVTAQAITDGGLYDVLSGRDWIVSIDYEIDGELHQCTGALLNERYIITAARCFDAHVIGIAQDPENWHVNLGMRDLTDEGGTQIMQFTDLYLHPGYNMDTFTNNVALLRMEDVADFELFGVNTIALPSTNQTFPDGLACWAQGWGRIHYADPEVPFIYLQEAQVHVMENTNCSSYWPAGMITAQDLCTGSSFGSSYPPHTTPFPSPCGLYDDGAPLSCVVNGQPVLAGVSSWSGQRCGDIQPPVYVSIPPFVEWIEGILSLG